MILIDPHPRILARMAKKAAERLARQERKLIERFERFEQRLLRTERRCPICGASTERARAERCRGACK
jgi:recombinational DNA repair protein RecR